MGYGVESTNEYSTASSILGASRNDHVVVLFARLSISRSVQHSCGVGSIFPGALAQCTKDMFIVFRISPGRESKLGCSCFWSVSLLGRVSCLQVGVDYMYLDIDIPLPTLPRRTHVFSLVRYPSRVISPRTRFEHHSFHVISRIV